MELEIDFDELLEAFELSNSENHYFLDTKNNEIVFISEYDDNYDQEIEKIDDSFIEIPKRFPAEDFRIIESFIYSLDSSDLKEKFINVIYKKKPFRNFKYFLDIYPEIKEKWFLYKADRIKNEAIEWLEANNIIIKNQKTEN